MRAFTLVFAFLLLPLSAWAQTAPPRAAEQIVAALTPLPEAFRASATVLGYRGDGDDPVVLREGDGPFICLADEPGDERFHVACYHRSLEPFMARGRQLRSQGRAEEVDSVRFAEVRTGTLPMPAHPAALYSLTGPPDSFDPASGEVRGAQPLFVIYVPDATGEMTGLPTEPVPNAPWLMSAGTPKAHIMFVPEMPR